MALVLVWKHEANGVQHSNYFCDRIGRSFYTEHGIANICQSIFRNVRIVDYTRSGIRDTEKIIIDLSNRY